MEVRIDMHVERFHDRDFLGGALLATSLAAGAVRSFARSGSRSPEVDAKQANTTQRMDRLHTMPNAALAKRTLGELILN